MNTKLVDAAISINKPYDRQTMKLIFYRIKLTTVLYPNLTRVIFFIIIHNKL